ncbi:MAG: hypothetical protein JOZ35_13365 [Hyphomicrobiales bacterium]|nr:hypothetical protein [Hyphomicrobiales bacterium]
MENSADKAMAAVSVIIAAARPAAAVGKELEHKIEQRHRFGDVRLGHDLIAHDPDDELSVSQAAAAILIAARDRSLFSRAQSHVEAYDSVCELADVIRVRRSGDLVRIK